LADGARRQGRGVVVKIDFFVIVKFRAKSFSTIAKLSANLPAFRGRTRLFLVLFKILGLAKEHVYVETRLRKPVAYRVRLDLHSWLQHIAYLTGGYEDDTVRFLLRLFQRHSSKGYCLDIGANIGLISIPLALLLQQEEGSGRVISIEAVADNYRALKTNISLNSLDADLLAVCAALGDRCKTAEIQVEGDLSVGEGSGTANILPEHSDFDCVRQKLQLETFDQIQ
jgi:FkbM family methyltransferase